MVTATQGRHLRGLGGRRPPPPPLPPQGKRKKEKKKEKKKKRKKRKKKEKRKKGTINNVKLLHINCCFSNFSIVRWHLKIKKIWPPRKSWNDAPAATHSAFVKFLSGDWVLRKKRIWKPDSCSIPSSTAPHLFILVLEGYRLDADEPFSQKSRTVTRQPDPVVFAEARFRSSYFFHL